MDEEIYFFIKFFNIICIGYIFLLILYVFCTIIQLYSDFAILLHYMQQHT